MNLKDKIIRNYSKIYLSRIRRRRRREEEEEEEKEEEGRRGDENVKAILSDPGEVEG